MTSRLTLIAGASALMVAASAATHAAEYSANVTVTSDYILRGVSQTEERPALQGGFDAAFDSGIYAGIWASNVNYDKATGGVSNANLEMDYYAGYGGTFGCTDCSYKVGFVYYDYHGDPGLDYIEAAVSIAYGGLTAGVYWSPEYLGEGTTDLIGDEVEYWYPYVNYSHALPGDFTLALHVGYTDMSETGVYEPGQDDYTDWSVGVSKSFADISFGVTYYDTNMDNLFGGGFEDAGSRLVLSASKAL
jgi:uncharacterized protein (TIGR02001 family)